MKKLLRKKFGKKEAIPTRITNDTVAEHRQRILAGGRRFKYPMQYVRHRLVINTIILAVAAVIILLIVGWQQLYIVQNTSNLIYRVTRIIPVPVASVDGQLVRYSDYLMYYNSSAHYLQQSEQIDLNSEGGKRQVAYVKRKSMDNVVADGYAAKLARDLNIKVDPKRVDMVISQDRNTSNGRISQETYDASALSILGWTPDEYRQAAFSKLLRQDVAFAVDSTAKAKATQAVAQTRSPSADFDKVAANLGGSGSAKVTAGVAGMVPLTNRDGGLTLAASKLSQGQASDVIKATTGDAYYIVKLIERTDTQLNYAFLKIPLTEFDNKLAAVKKAGKVTEYITVPPVDTQVKAP